MDSATQPTTAYHPCPCGSGFNVTGNTCPSCDAGVADQAGSPDADIIPFPQDATTDAASDQIAEIRRKFDAGELPILYGMTDKDKAELDCRFTYHSPRPNQIPRYQQLRDKAREFAQLIHDLTPPSREQALAFTHLQEATMWANAAIACREGQQS